MTDVKLLPETIAVIERIVQSGHNARVTTGKDGVTVYEEKVKKVHIEKRSRKGTAARAKSG